MSRFAMRVHNVPTPALTRVRWLKLEFLVGLLHVTQDYKDVLSYGVLRCGQVIPRDEGR